MIAINSNGFITIKLLTYQYFNKQFIAQNKDYIIAMDK